MTTVEYLTAQGSTTDMTTAEYLTAQEYTTCMTRNPQILHVPHPYWNYHYTPSPRRQMDVECEVWAALWTKGYHLLGQH